MNFDPLKVHLDDELILDGATSHLWIKTSETILLPHLPALMRAAKRGVAIMIILFGTHPERFQFGGKSRTYLHEGNGVPVGIAHYLVTLTVDFAEALVTEIGGKQRGSYTRNKPIVHLAETMLRHELYFAEIFEKFGAPIQNEFGPALLELRRKYLPIAQVEALETLLGLPSAANGADGGISKEATVGLAKQRTNKQG